MKSINKMTDETRAGGASQAQPENELTDKEIERIDLVHNEIHDLINRLNPKGTEVEWDVSVIAEVADVIEDYLVAKGICTAMEFCPYREA